MVVIAVECIIISLVLEMLFAIILGVKDRSDYTNILIVNLLTNPVVLIISTIIGIKYGSSYHLVSLVIISQSSVILEGIVYYKFLKYKKLHPFFLSFLLNFISYSIIELINLWRF